MTVSEFEKILDKDKPKKKCYKKQYVIMLSAAIVFFIYLVYNIINIAGI
jgi:hypothetical protein